LVKSLYEDLNLILTDMPINYEHKDLLTSLSLFTFYSSQRRCTVLYVKFGKINLLRDENTKKVKRIVITLKRTKGNKENYNRNTSIHRISEENMCFIEAFERYLTSEFNINYDNFVEFQINNKGKLVLDITKDQFTIQFSYIWEQRGYTKGSMSPHSLRHGGVGNLIFKGQTNSYTNNDKLSRLIGGWVTKRTAHRRYVKKMTLSTISCKRIIDPQIKKNIVYHLY
jgi:hypothetical protein